MADKMFLIALGQLLLGLFMWLGWDRRLMSEKIASWSERRHWILLLFIFGGFVFAGYGWYMSYHRDLQPSPTVALLPSEREPLRLIGWGNNGQLCTATIEASASSREYRDKYEMALVCGFQNPMVDMFKDSDVAISPLFTIQPNITSITVPNRQEMNDRLKSQIETIVKQSPLPKGTPFTVSFAWWFRVVVLPKNTDMSSIHRLADVPTHGGEVLHTAGGQSVGLTMATK
jgi:hypothetical protein